MCPPGISGNQFCDNAGDSSGQVIDLWADQNGGRNRSTAPFGESVRQAAASRDLTRLEGAES
jgi:hypothetical protein